MGERPQAVVSEPTEPATTRTRSQRKWAILACPRRQSLTRSRADFGANEWLVDELYEQYLKDKNAVDPAWWDFFEGYQPRATVDPAPDGTPASANGNGAVPAAAAARAPSPRRRRSRADPNARRRSREPAAPSPSPRTSPAARAGPRRHGPARRRPRTPSAAIKTVARQPDDVADDGTRSCAAPPPASSPTWRPASRSRPRPACARSPAKLLVDNRIVVNNHLARGRGGKVSFTHLIGYAARRGARRRCRR